MVSTIAANKTPGVLLQTRKVSWRPCSLAPGAVEALNRKLMSRSPPLRVRVATATDISLLSAVERSAYQHAWTEGDFEDIFRRHATGLIVEDTTVIGFVLWGHESDHEAEVINLASIRPGEGYGPLLIRAMLSVGDFTRSDRLRLMARVSNTKAVRFYERIGFRRRRERSSYWRPDGETGVAMAAFVRHLAFAWRFRAVTTPRVFARIARLEQSLEPNLWALDAECQKWQKSSGAVTPDIARRGWHISANPANVVRKADFAFAAEYLGWDGSWRVAGYLYGFLGRPDLPNFDPQNLIDNRQRIAARRNSGKTLCIWRAGIHPAFQDRSLGLRLRAMALHYGALNGMEWVTANVASLRNVTDDRLICVNQASLFYNADVLKPLCERDIRDSIQLTCADGSKKTICHVSWKAYGNRLMTALNRIDDRAQAAGIDLQCIRSDTETAFALIQGLKKQPRSDRKG